MKKNYLFIAILFVLLFGSGFTYFSNSGKKLTKILEKDFSFVPSGMVEEDGKTLSVQAFYMQKTEVTNKEYQLFLTSLKAQGEMEKWKIAQVDSLKWNTNRGKNQKYVDFYATHPAYQQYPVVNISYEAANLYCEWLSGIYAAKYPEIGPVKFRLPTREEFIRAARGESNFAYAWSSNYLRNKDGLIQGNFLNVGAEEIHRDSTGKFAVLLDSKRNEQEFAKASDVLAPAKSFWPNQFGIYNLNGNAAEMTNAAGISTGGSWKTTGYDLQLERTEQYNGANPQTGFRVVMTLLAD